MNRPDPEIEEYSQPTETEMVLIPVLIEAVGAVVFIACALLLVVVLSTPAVPV